jgi:IS1 family transposase
MKRLTREKQTQVISALIEGNSIRATARMMNVSKGTVLKLQVEAGYVSADYQDKTFHGLTCKRVQCDEVWAFCYAKEKNAPQEKKGRFGYGGVWTWTGIDGQTKLIPCFTIGNRDAVSAKILIEDLDGRLKNRIQLTTDGHRAYLEAVERAFGCDIDYAVLVEAYESSQGETRYSPAIRTSCERKPIMGDPDPDHISASYVEPSNLSIRMGARRFTRLTNAFSEKVENHAAAVALNYFAYNFIQIHRTLRMSPAMAAGVTGHLWSVEDLVALWESEERRLERAA